MAIAPEGFFRIVRDALGFRDIQFESEEFNRRFKVNCDDRRFASTFVDPRMMQFLLDTAGKTRFEVAGPWTLCAVDRLEPDRVPEVVTYNEGFQAQIPAVVSDLHPLRWEPSYSSSGAFVLLLVLAAVISYNRFVTQRHLIDNSWSNIDTELRRRYNLIPNLVETVRGYASHERETLEAVVRARTSAVASTGPPDRRRRLRTCSSTPSSTCWRWRSATRTCGPASSSWNSSMSL